VSGEPVHAAASAGESLRWTTACTPVRCPRRLLVRTRAIREGDALAIPGYQARVLERTARRSGQRRHHTGAVAIALPHGHMPRRLLRMASRLKRWRHGCGRSPAGSPNASRSTPAGGVEPLAPQHGHDHAHREQQPVPDGLPGPLRRQSPPVTQQWRWGCKTRV